MEEFIAKFVEIFDDLDVKDVQAETEFRNLDDWDSIAGLSLIGMIDEEYGVDFNSDDMKACKTVADLYNRVQSKK